MPFIHHSMVNGPHLQLRGRGKLREYTQAHTHGFVPDVEFVSAYELVVDEIRL